MTYTSPALKRLSYQSWHRRTREMDLILGKFADHFLETMSLEEQKEYALLLEENDSDLWEWLNKSSAIPSKKNSKLLEKIREFHLSLFHFNRGCLAAFVSSKR